MKANTEDKILAASLFFSISAGSAWGCGKFFKRLIFEPADDQTLLLFPAIALSVACSAFCLLLAARVISR